MLRSLLVSAVAAAVPCAATSFCEDPAWATVWRDDFEGTELDERFWTINLKSGDSRVRSACGRRENVAVRNGTLVLTSRREQVDNCSYNFTTGAIATKGKVSWQGHTRACVKAILPGVPGKADGVWPAHWMVADNENCWPTNGEIDIMEMIDGNGESHATYHASPSGRCNKDKDKSAFIKVSNWNTQYHEYAAEYNSTHVTFVVDGQVVNTITPSDNLPLYDVPYYMILNTALGGSSWPGPVRASTVFPIEHIIDSVVIVQKKS